MATLLGQRTTASISADVKFREVEEDITMVQPNRTPFVTLTMKAGSKPTQSVKFEHGEDDYLRKTVKVNGSHLSTDLVLNLDNNMTELLKVGVQLWNKTTGEHMRVTDVDHAANTATIVRAEGSVVAAAIADDEELIIASESGEEGVKYGSSPSTELTLLENFVEEFEHSVEMSNLQLITKNLTENDWQQQIKKGGGEFKEKMETAFFFGTKKGPITGPNGKRMYYTGGLYSFIKDNAPAANIKTSVGLLTEKVLEDWLETIFRFGDPNKKLIITSPFVQMAIGRLAKGTVQTEQSEKTLGLKITRLTVVGFDVTIATTQLFASLGVNDYMFLVDMGSVKMRHLQGNGLSGNVKWYHNVQDKDLKGRKDVIHGIKGLHVKNTKAHGVMSGITG